MTEKDLLAICEIANKRLAEIGKSLIENIDTATLEEKTKYRNLCKDYEKICSLDKNEEE